MDREVLRNGAIGLRLFPKRQAQKANRTQIAVLIKLKLMLRRVLHLFRHNIVLAKARTQIKSVLDILLALVKQWLLLLHSLTVLIRLIHFSFLLQVGIILCIGQVRLILDHVAVTIIHLSAKRARLPRRGGLLRYLAVVVEISLETA